MDERTPHRSGRTLEHGGGLLHTELTEILRGGIER
jgi:hypothetical protein